MGSVGYAEVRAHLAGDLPRDALRDAIVQSTRIFARPHCAPFFTATKAAFEI